MDIAGLRPALALALALSAAIAILRAHGSNILRLRLLVNPNQDEVPVNDLEYTVRMAGDPGARSLHLGRGLAGAL